MHPDHGTKAMGTPPSPCPRCVAYCLSSQHNRSVPFRAEARAEAKAW